MSRKRIRTGDGAIFRKEASVLVAVFDKHYYFRNKPTRRYCTGIKALLTAEQEIHLEPKGACL